MATIDEFRSTVDACVSEFPSNGICRRLDANEMTLRDYHAILRMIFPQTYHGPQGFALAGVNCPQRYQEAKDYLIQHAEEERTHWRWVIGDLERTGDSGPSVETAPPKPAAQNYVSFMYYVAQRQPLGRLAIAAVLESIGARYGKTYATRICEVVGLSPSQVQFFFGHGDTDVGHAEDVLRVLGSCRLTPEEWGEMSYVARTAARLYRSMYDEAANAERVAALA